MRIAVTGSSGLIGRKLVGELTAAGHEVIRVVRPGTPPVDGETITWDPVAGRIDSAGFEGLDAVVHLAGAGIGDRRWTAARKIEIRVSRTAATALLSTTLACLDEPPAVLVSGSAIGYYGDRGDEVLTEESGPGTGFLAEVCAEWEEATRPAAEAGIRVVTIRTGIVLSARGGLLARLLPLYRLGLGGRLGPAERWWSWISLEDHVAAVTHLLSSPLAGPVNLTAPEPVRNDTFNETLGRVLGRPARLTVPRIAFAALMGREAAREMLASQRVLPARLTADGFRFTDTDLEAALRRILDR